MTRIVAGAAKGRRLRTPPRGTRPTSERVREALFSSLGDVTGARVLDLFAGSGALGLEALSRGAQSACFVESDRSACAVLRMNIEALALPGAQLHCTPVQAFLRRREPGHVVDIVLADAPYALDDEALGEVLAALACSGRLARDGVVVVERSARGAAPRWPDEITAGRQRRYGETVLWYGHRR